jgi:hypothetical protein
MVGRVDVDPTFYRGIRTAVGVAHSRSSTSLEVGERESMPKICILSNQFRTGDLLQGKQISTKALYVRLYFTCLTRSQFHTLWAYSVEWEHRDKLGRRQSVLRYYSNISSDGLRKVRIAGMFPKR